MTQLMIELLKSLIKAELEYRNRYQTWLDATELGKSEMTFPMHHERLVVSGTFNKKTAQALVDLGFAQWESRENGADLMLAQDY